jgi:predicted aconitase
LTDHEKAQLSGGLGQAPAMAMSIIVRMAEIQGAAELLEISAAHIDSTIYMGQATLDFAERLVQYGARVVVPTSLNVSGVDEAGWREWHVSPEWAENARRQMVAYESMGCEPTWTCTPYQTSFKPAFGQQIAWGESNAILYANSVIGARTERYPDLMDICAAITGKVPAVGLHLTENRAGQILIQLVDIPIEVQKDDSFYPVLGHMIGKTAGEKIPVVEGLRVRPLEDQYKAMCAPAASSGSVALFHIVGHTPEAATMEQAFQGKKPEEEVWVGLEDLRHARRELSTSFGDQLDLVALGGPHFSLEEFKQLAPLIEGKRRHPDIRFLVSTSRAVKTLAERAGYLDPLIGFGGTLTLDTCILATPMLPPEIKILMTNSGKFAYYSPGLLDVGVVFGSLEECVRSAVEGTVYREKSPWGE